MCQWIYSGRIPILWHPSSLNMLKYASIPISSNFHSNHPSVLWLTMRAYLSDVWQHQLTNHINFPGQESFQIWHKRLLPVLHDLIQPPCMPLFDVEIIAELLDENWAYSGGTIHKLEVETHIKSWCQPLLNVRVNQIAILWFCSSGTLGDGRRRLCWVGQSSQNQRIRLQKWIGKPWICVRAIQKKIPSENWRLLWKTVHLSIYYRWFTC